MLGNESRAYRSVPIFEFTKSTNLGNTQDSELFLPSIESRFAGSHLPTNLCDGSPCLRSLAKQTRKAIAMGDGALHPDV